MLLFLPFQLRTSTQKNVKFSTKKVQRIEKKFYGGEKNRLRAAWIFSINVFNDGKESDD